MPPETRPNGGTSDNMKHTASVSIADRQVEEIENTLNIFFIGIKNHEAAVDCKRIIDLRFPKIPEAKRLNEAKKDDSFMKIMNSRARIFELVERI